MSSFPTRRSARIAAAALGAVAALTLPTAAQAFNHDLRDNGELAYTQNSGGTSREAFLVWPDGTHGRKADDVNVFGRGIVGGFSPDGEMLMLTDPDTWKEHFLLQPWSNGGAYAYHSYDGDDIGRLGQGAVGENNATLFWGTTNGLRRNHGPSPTEFLTTSEALDPGFANIDRLVWVSPTQGVMLLDDASTVAAPVTGRVLVPGAGFQHASISRDGAHVAYAEHDGTSWNVRVVPADGSLPPANLETGTDGSDETLATMSPDGTKVAFVSDRSGKPAIWVAPVDGSAPATMVPNTERAGSATIEGLSWQPGLKPYHNPTTLVTWPAGMKVGNTVRPNYGGQPEATPTADVTYEWLRCSIRRSANGACTTTGESGTEYVLKDADKGYKIKLKRTTTNAAGTRTSEALTTGWIEPDGPMPTTPVISAPTKAVAGTTAKVEWGAADDQYSWFECSTDWGITWSTCVSGVEATGLKNGYNPFYVRQRNDFSWAGNYADASITSDQEKPYPPNFGGWPFPFMDTMAGEFSWYGEGRPENRFECSEDGGAWTACTSPYTMTVTTPGQHKLRVREIDGVGNVSDAAERTWTAKQPAPPVLPAAAPARTSGPAALTNVKAATIAFTGADPNGTGFECRVDAGAWAACTSPLVTAALADGPHTADVRQLNAAGPGAELRTAWTVDTVKPAAPAMQQQPSGTVPDTTARLVFTTEAGATAECQVDGAAWMACASPLELTGLAAGTHRVLIRQTDAAGNVSNSRIVNWSVAPPAGGGVVAAPTVEAPAPEAPVTNAAPATAGTTGTATGAATPGTTTPKATAAAPAPAAAKPTITADLGGTKATGTTGTAAAPSITVSGDGVGVGCSAGTTALSSCTVDLYASTATAGSARAAAAAKVLVGHGTYRRAAGTRRMTVAVTLNATGRALLRRAPGGLRVSVAITGRPVAGGTLRASGTATLLAHRVGATVGGFATDHAELTAAAKRQLRTLARQVRGTAKAVRVIGHTDASTTDSAYLKRLGARRARAVAAYLRAHGVTAKVTLASRGAAAPRATNATAAGRARNRRVELRIER